LQVIMVHFCTWKMWCRFKAEMFCANHPFQLYCLSLSIFGVHHSWLTNQVVVCDNYWWWWSWALLFLFCVWFCLLLFMYNSWILCFCGAQCWNLEVHSSLLYENGYSFIGFMCATQGKQHCMEELLKCVTQLSTTFLKLWVIWF